MHLSVPVFAHLLTRNIICLNPKNFIIFVLRIIIVPAGGLPAAGRRMQAFDKMKKNIFFLSFLFLSLVAFYQCHRDIEPSKLGTFDFTEQDRSIVPYNGGEILVFRDSLGDSIPVTVENRYIGYMEIHENNNDPDANYYDVEHDQIMAPGIFDIWLSNTCPPIAPSGVKGFQIDLFYLHAYHPEIKGSFEGTWGFDSGNLFQLQNGTHSLAFYDSLTIVNKKYYSVYDLSHTGAMPPDSIETFINVYYSVTYGFAGFKTSKGRRWYIEKINK